MRAFLCVRVCDQEVVSALDVVGVDARRWVLEELAVVDGEVQTADDVRHVVEGDAHVTHHRRAGGDEGLSELVSLRVQKVVLYGTLYALQRVMCGGMHIVPG